VKSIGWLLGLAAWFALSIGTASAGEPLSLIQSIALPDVKGQIEPATHWVFFVALGNNTVEVADADAEWGEHPIAKLPPPTESECAQPRQSRPVGFLRGEVSRGRIANKNKSNRTYIS